MSNVLFPKGREGILDRSIDMTGDIRVMLTKSTYVYDDTDEYLADVGATDNGRSATLSGHSYSLGVFDAGDTSLTATSATACNALILFSHTGSDASARLIAYVDTPASGLPVTPAASGTVNISWDNGTNKIFKL
jgi:hypothetical protein